MCSPWADRTGLAWPSPKEMSLLGTAFIRNCALITGKICKRAILTQQIVYQTGYAFLNKVRNKINFEDIKNLHLLNLFPLLKGIYISHST